MNYIKIISSKSMILILLGITILFFINSVYALECYQETATENPCNSTTIGMYSYGRNTALFDCPYPEYNTWCDYSIRDGSYLHMIYAKPTYATNLSRIKYKFSTSEFEVGNSTSYIPDECWNYNTTFLHLRLFSKPNTNILQCYKGPIPENGWVTINQSSYLVLGNQYCNPPHTNAAIDGDWNSYEHYHGSGCYQWGAFITGFYEEAMIWNITDPEQCTSGMCCNTTTRKFLPANTTFDLGKICMNNKLLLTSINYCNGTSANPIYMNSIENCHNTNMQCLYDGAGNGGCIPCQESIWSPLAEEVCNNIYYTQYNQCNYTNSNIGTKDCNTGTVIFRTNDTQYSDNSYIAIASKCGLPLRLYLYDRQIDFNMNCEMIKNIEPAEEIVIEIPGTLGKTSPIRVFLHYNNINVIKLCQDNGIQSTVAYYVEDLATYTTVPISLNNSPQNPDFEKICCMETEWFPSTSEYCDDIIIEQTSNCNTKRNTTGTKQCNYAFVNISNEPISLTVPCINKKDITFTLQKAIDNCVADSDGYCNIPIAVDTSNYQVTLNDLNITIKPYAKKEKIELKKGWNLLSINPANLNVPNTNLLLEPGWNLIGYSALRPMHISNMQFNYNGVQYTFDQLLENNLIQNGIYYYDKGYKIIPYDDSFIRAQKSYWIFAKDYIFLSYTPSSGGTYKDLNWNRLYLEKQGIQYPINNSFEYNLTDGVFYEYDHGAYKYVPYDTEILYPWKGYWLYSNENNISLGFN